MNNMSARQMRNVQLDENLTKRVYTAFDSVSLIGFLKLLISRSEWAVSKDVFSKRRIATFGFIPLNMNFGNFFFFAPIHFAHSKREKQQRLKVGPEESKNT